MGDLILGVSACGYCLFWLFFMVGRGFMIFLPFVFDLHVLTHSPSPPPGYPSPRQAPQHPGRSLTARRGQCQYGAWHPGATHQPEGESSVAIASLS